METGFHMQKSIFFFSVDKIDKIPLDIFPPLKKKKKKKEILKEEKIKKIFKSLLL